MNFRDAFPLTDSVIGAMATPQGGDIAVTALFLPLAPFLDLVSLPIRICAAPWVRRRREALAEVVNVEGRS